MTSVVSKTLWGAACLALTLLTTATLATAQERILARYGTTIGPEDNFNSSGTRLTKMRGLIAQDRANYHRFGIRHRSDASDPIFHQRSMRAQLSTVPMTICCGQEEHIEQGYARGYSPYVAVTVYGVGSRITRVHVEVPG